MLMFVLAGVASSEPVASGSASAGGWYVAAPGIGGSTLTPSVSASYPCDPEPCENSRQLAGASVGTIATADVLYAQAQAFQNPDADATLQAVMQGAAGFTLPTDWNTRGYARIEGFTALNGQIVANTVEAETVFGSLPSGSTYAGVSASGVQVLGLRLAGLLSSETLAPILPNTPNQVLLDTGTVRIVYWETNWNPSNGTTTDGQPIWVNALHITDSVTGADITLSLASTDALFPPVARDDVATTTQDTAVKIDVDANDSDADGDLNRASVTVTQAPTNGTVTCDNTGECTYTPRAGWSGTDSFTYRICDTAGACDTATVTITVSAATPPPPPPSNRAPEATDDSGNTSPGTAVTLNVVTNDNDPDGDPLTLTGSGTTTNGGTYVCSGTDCTYTPADGFAGNTDTFTYTVCDPSNACDTATVTITVSAATPPPPPPPSNDPPTAAPDSGTTDPGTAITLNVVANDNDPDGDALTLTGSGTTINGGTFACSGTDCTYTPAPGFNGADDTFSYTVCDPSNACATATVTITVRASVGPPPPPPPANDPPTAAPDSGTTDPGTAITLNVVANDNDPDGDPLTLTGSGTTANGGTYACSGTDCTYTPAAGFNGRDDTFSYTVCDPSNACATATVTITVRAATPPPPPPPVDTNEAPQAADDAANTAPGTAVTLNVVSNDNDPDGDALTLTGSGTTTNGGTYACSGTDCTYTPADGFAGNTDSFTYTVCDPSNACDTATVTITVSAATPPPPPPPVDTNEAPQATDDAANTPFGTAVTIPVAANDTDGDGDALTVTTANGVTANGGLYSCSGSSCTYTPAADFTGPDTFTYEICDPSGACDTATVTVTVAPSTGGTGGTGGTANQAPNAADDAANTNGNPSVTIPVVANDSDPDGNLVPVAQVTVHPTNGAVVCQQASCTYTPNDGFSGTDTFEYQVCDSLNVCDPATVTITVPVATNNNGGSGNGGATNSPPEAEDDTATSNDGAPVTIEVVPNDSDRDGNLNRDAVQVTVPPQHGAVICSGGACTYTPDTGYTGPDEFEYRVCDTQLACDTATVVIEVTGPPVVDDNAPPVALDDTKTGRPGGAVTIDVINNDSDPEGELDPASVLVTQPPANGSVTCTDGKCTYTPEPGFSGSDSFEYRVCDLLGACTTATVTITVPSLSVGEGDGGGPDRPGDGNGDNNGGGPGPNDGNDGGDGPGSDGEPALPGDTPPNAPIDLDSPLLGAPNAPLPLTGGEPSFYLGAALNLLLIGMLLLLIERFTRASRTLKPCPSWHNHAEAPDATGCAYGEWVKEPRVMLLLIERFKRSRNAPEPCPAWHNHAEAHDSKGCAYGEWS